MEKILGEDIKCATSTREEILLPCMATYLANGHRRAVPPKRQT